MTSELQQELRQTRPFESPAIEAYLNLLRTQGLLAMSPDRLLRGHGLTPVSYNILRILRGAGAKGLPCNEIGNRLVTRVPDVTRLVDRLVESGWVARHRTEADRRLVIQTITPKGLAVLETLDGPLEAVVRQQMSHMTPAELETLNHLLVKARSAVKR